MFNHPEIAKRLLSNGTLKMELSDLVGEFTLTGVDRDTTQIKSHYSDDFENSQVFSFILNGVTYSVVEDPGDGYRSSMRHVIVETYQVKNTFQPIEVVAKYFETNDDDDYYHKKCDILKLYCKESNKLLLQAGTDNTDDYYPYFVSEWHPENILY